MEYKSVFWTCFILHYEETEWWSTDFVFLIEIDQLKKKDQSLSHKYIEKKNNQIFLKHILNISIKLSLILFLFVSVAPINLKITYLIYWYIYPRYEYKPFSFDWFSFIYYQQPLIDKTFSCKAWLASFLSWSLAICDVFDRTSNY